LMSWLNIKII